MAQESSLQGGITIPAILPPLGVASNFVNPYNLSKYFTPYIAVLLAITTTFVWIRIYSKIRLIKSHGWEDCKFESLIEVLGFAVTVLILYRYFHHSLGKAAPNETLIGSCPRWLNLDLVRVGGPQCAILQVCPLWLGGSCMGSSNSTCHRSWPGKLSLVVSYPSMARTSSTDKILVVQHRRISLFTHPRNHKTFHPTSVSALVHTQPEEQDLLSDPIHHLDQCALLPLNLHRHGLCMHSQAQDLVPLDSRTMRQSDGGYHHFSWVQRSFGFFHVAASNEMYLAVKHAREAETSHLGCFCYRFAVSFLFFSTFSK